MSIKKYNISKPEKYMKDGAEKTYWANVGTMTEFEKQDGSISRIIEIPAISLKANIFEQKERDNRMDGYQTTAPKVATRPAQPASEAEPIETIEYPTEELNPDDIPF